MEQDAAIIRRRKTKRYGKSGAVTLRRAISAPLITGSLFDLSMGGCLIWVDQCCQIDASELIEVKLQSEKLTFRVMGSVRHTSEAGRLLGIQFHRLGVKDALELEQIILQIQAAASQENLMECL